MKSLKDIIEKYKEVKEIADAAKDIAKIETVLDSTQFNSKANSLYDELKNKIDYAPYIAVLKAGRGMCGNQSFGALSYIQKRKVLEMIKDAIEVYIRKTVEKQEKKD